MNHVRWQTRYLNIFSFIIFVFIILNTLSVFAGPAHTTYQAKIIKPDGLPLEAVNVNFKFTILDPAGACILYAETYSSVNMSGTGGLISFALGSGVRTYPVSATTFEQVFSNVTSSLSCDAGGPVSYSPLAADTRKIVMQFHDGAGWQTLPAMNINAVPYAMYANEAQKISGLPSCNPGEALSYNGATFSCETISGGGSVTSSTITAALGYTPADDVNVSAITSNISNVSTTVFSVSSTVASLSTSVSTLTSTVAASFSAITSSQWLSSGTAISYSSGNVGIGTTTPSAKLHIAAGTSSTTAFKLTSGTLLTTPAAGAVEYDGFNLYYTDGANTRRTVATDASGVTSSAIASALGYTPANSSTVTSLSNTVATLSATVSGLSGSSAWTASGSTINFSNNVGIGTTNPLAKLDVSGTARISGQVLLGNNPATGGVFDFGTLFGTPTSPYSGPFFLQETATDLSAAHTIGHGVSLKLDSSVDSSGLVFAGLDYLQVAPGNTSAYASLYGRLTAVENRTSGNVSEITGLSAFLLQTGSGTVFQTNALTARSLIYGGSVQSNFGGYFSAVNVGGQVTNNYGAYIDSAFGSVANNYGLFINDQSAVAASQTYNIYSAGSNASNVFRGRVGVGLDLPTARLHLSAGSTSLAPLKLSTGPLLISPQSGSIEYNGFNLFYTDSSNVRQTVATEASLSDLSATVASLAAVVSAGGTSQWTTSGSAITFAGDVGIGLTNPAAALDVSGQLAAGSRHTWLGGNLGGLPIPGDATLLGTSVLGWNASNGSGETNLINSKGPGSPGGFTFDQWDGTSRTTRMMIHGATGFVGIGTTNPTQLLDVSGTAQANKFLAANGAFNNPSIAFSNSPTTGFYNNGGNLGISIGGALKGTWSTSSLGFNAGGAGPQIYFTGGNAAQPSYAFNSDPDTGMFNPNPSGGSNELAFSTSGTEKVRISSTGNVGLGTSAPLGTLDIAWGGASGFVGGADMSSSTRTTNTNKWFRYAQVPYNNSHSPFLAIMTGATNTENGVYFGGGTTLQPNATALRFFTGTSQSTNGGALERMSILPLGYVGIGTTTPNSLLQLGAGTSATTAFKMTSGTLLTAPQAGAVEYDGANYYITNGASVRRMVATIAGAGNFDSVSTITSTGNISAVPTGSFIVSSTTASTNSSTGALVVRGGAGIQGDLFTAGVINTNLYTVSPIIYGSTASGGSLTLDSTTHANKGNIYLAPTGGNVGIGTTEPATSLHIFSTQPAGAGHPHRAGLILESEGASVGGRLALKVSSDTENPLFVGYRARGTASSPTALFSGDIITSIAPVGYDGAGGWQTGAHIRFNTTENWSAGGIGSSISFRTPANSSTSVVERMKIDHNGNVGIGTSAPESNLHIVSTSPGNGVKIQGTGANAPAFRLYSGADLNSTFGTALAAGHFLPGTAVGDSVLTTNIASNLIFGTSTTEKMRITNAGNVGIGTSAPLVKLTVDSTNGTVSAPYVPATDKLAVMGTGSAVIQVTTPNTGAGGIYFSDPESRDPGGMVYSHLTDNLVFRANHATRMTLSASGHLGVGTGSPTSQFTVNSTHNINTGSNFANAVGALRIQDGSSIGLLFDSNQIEQLDTSNSLYLNHNSSATTILNYGGGNVGVGLLVPGAKLDVSNGTNTMASNGQGAAFRISNPTSANSDYFQVGWISEDNWGIMTADSVTHRNLVVTPWGGNLGVGNISPTYKLDVSGDIRITGTPYRNGGDSNWIVPSDARLKDVVSGYNRGLREIANIDTIIFNYKKDNPKEIDSSVKYTGVLAQQVQKQIPEAVNTDKDGFLSLNTGPIFWAMVNAIKELYHNVLGIKAENTQLKEQVVVQARKIQSLEEENAAVKARLERIEKALEKTK